MAFYQGKSCFNLKVRLSKLSCVFDTLLFPSWQCCCTKGVCCSSVHSGVTIKQEVCYWMDNQVKKKKNKRNALTTLVSYNILDFVHLKKINQDKISVLWFKPLMILNMKRVYKHSIYPPSWQHLSHYGLLQWDLGKGGQATCQS